MQAKLGLLTSRGRLLATAMLCVLAWPAAAATVIRDAEIESTIRTISNPIFTAARLDPDSIDVYVLRDSTLNAFVAGGQNLFINTGLIIHTTSPDELAGVIAHETGHIAGGHLSRSLQAQEEAGVSAIAGALLGAAAAAAGAPAVGMALMAGGATVAQRGLLKFTRGQEESADQAAVTYLTALKQSPQGLVDFFQVLQTQNLRISADGNVFLRTHPLTSDRMEFLERQVAASPYRDARPDPALVAAYARIVAKLDGFLSDPQDVMRRRASDSVPDRYARAIAYYRIPDLDKSLGLLDGLMAELPKDPYFPEMKGQILFENGRVSEAVAPYRQALRYRPNSSLIRYGLARALMEDGQDKDLEEAKNLLLEVVRIEPDNGSAWRFLGIAEGRLGREGPSALALAEQAVLANNRKDAQFYLRRAEQFVQPNDPEWLQLQDLSRAVDDMEEPRQQRRP